jgi:hypothetical protein
MPILQREPRDRPDPAKGPEKGHRGVERLGALDGKCLADRGALSCLGLSGHGFMVGLVTLLPYLSRLEPSYLPRIFLEAHHGTQASRSAILGTRTKSAICTSSEPARLRRSFRSQRARGALGPDRGAHLQIPPGRPPAKVARPAGASTSSKAEILS